MIIYLWVFQYKKEQQKNASNGANYEGSKKFGYSGFLIQRAVRARNKMKKKPSNNIKNKSKIETRRNCKRVMVYNGS